MLLQMYLFFGLKDNKKATFSNLDITYLPFSVLLVKNYI